MSTTEEDGMDVNLGDQHQAGHHTRKHSEHDGTLNKDQYFNYDEYQTKNRENRKRRNDRVDQEFSADSLYTPKRKTIDQNGDSTHEKSKTHKTTTSSWSYFNSSQKFNKQNNESSLPKQTYEVRNKKQSHRDTFPPFRILIKDDQYPAKDVTIIKEINKTCNLNLTYGRMSSSKTNRCYLLYCNTSNQFEYLLDKTKWPNKLCGCDYTYDLPKKIPTAYSIVMSNIPIQWDVKSFCDELKLQYKTIIRSERLYVRGGRPISKIRIDFSSNKELTEILKNKRMLLDDNHTSYPIEPYVPPPKVLRCYICQQYDDHVAAHCPNKDKPICFRCGQQHQYDPECQNKISCAHCKGDHMAGNPSCPRKVETRVLKRLQINSSSTSNYIANRNIWTGNSVSHLFGNTSTSSIRTDSNSSENSHSINLLDTIHSNIQSILRQQSEINKHLSNLTIYQNNQAKEIINLNQVLNDIVCPLLKETTQILYTQTNSHQKRQIDPFYNKLIKHLNQKVTNCLVSQTSFENKTSATEQEISHISSSSSNSPVLSKNNESQC